MHIEPVIELRGVYKRFPTRTGGSFTALRDLTFQVAPGEFCAVVGPPGCGKSTTLALISGQPGRFAAAGGSDDGAELARSEEHTSEPQSRFDLVCRLLLAKQ